MTFKRTLSIIIINILLSACSWQQSDEPPYLESRVSQTPAQLWAQQQSKLKQLNQWQLRAQLAVITSDSRNSASLFWQQESITDYQVNLTGPFGVHLMTAKYTQGIASLILDDNKTYHHPSISVLINSFSPIPVPVNELRYWMIGEPLTQDYQLDKSGRIKQAKHPLGWEINYLNYRLKSYNSGNNKVSLWLPTKINILKDDIRIKIAIREWTLDATTN